MSIFKKRRPPTPDELAREIHDVNVTMISEALKRIIKGVGYSLAPKTADVPIDKIQNKVGFELYMLAIWSLIWLEFPLEIVRPVNEYFYQELKKEPGMREYIAKTTEARILAYTEIFGDGSIKHMYKLLETIAANFGDEFVLNPIAELDIRTHLEILIRANFSILKDLRTKGFIERKG